MPAPELGAAQTQGGHAVQLATPIGPADENNTPDSRLPRLRLRRQALCHCRAILQPRAKQLKWRACATHALWFWERYVLRSIHSGESQENWTGSKPIGASSGPLPAYTMRYGLPMSSRLRRLQRVQRIHIHTWQGPSKEAELWWLHIQRSMPYEPTGLDVRTHTERQHAHDMRRTAHTS